MNCITNALSNQSMRIEARETPAGLVFDTHFEDDHVVVSLPDLPRSPEFVARVYHEVIFRRIHTYLKDVLVGNWIDLGAWIGDNAIPWAKQSTERIVYAIDPGPDNCDYIRTVAQINGLENVRVLQLAITDRPKTLTTDEDLSHCTLHEGTDGKHKVEGCSLDSLLRARVVTDIGYIHLDVEGMEWDVIRGAEEIIRTYRPVLTVEQHMESDDYRGLTNYLKERGYRVFLIHETLAGNRQDCRNLIAFPCNRDVDSIAQRLGVPILIEEL